MVESQQPREEPEGWSSLRDEGEELQEEQQQQGRPAAAPATPVLTLHSPCQGIWAKFTMGWAGMQ